MTIQLRIYLRKEISLLLLHLREWPCCLCQIRTSCPRSILAPISSVVALALIDILTTSDIRYNIGYRSGSWRMTLRCSPKPRLEALSVLPPYKGMLGAECGCCLEQCPGLCLWPVGYLFPLFNTKTFSSFKVKAPVSLMLNASIWYLFWSFLATVTVVLLTLI